MTAGPQKGQASPGDVPVFDVPVFDVLGELPTGTTVLEASAGTGKTTTIADLATRYVAEGHARLPELLLVTFGRAATSELRDRVRERLVRTHRALADADAAESRDPLVAHLAAVDPPELARRRERLGLALAEFDAATIATTHGFCQQLLTSLGVVGDVDPEAVLVPDIADLVDEVVDDLYIARYAELPTPPLTVADAREVARAAVSDPRAVLEPTLAPGDTLPGHRYAFARAAAEEVAARKRRRRVLDYDDLLGLLDDALRDEARGAAVAERVRADVEVVLVDEFQDTDPVQWRILDAAFRGHRTLVLIGDPKQAIYAFRGGDVVTYLGARRHAATRTLGRSWRSDESLVRALGDLFHGVALGDEAITVRPLEAAHTGRRLDGGPPLRLRQVTRRALGTRGRDRPRVGPVRELVAADVARDVVEQLGSTRLEDAGGWRPLRPGDVAVLTRRNADAAAVRDALVAAGVPAVVSGLASVFAGPAATDWLTLLTALDQPTHRGRTAALALTPFVGWDAARLASATEGEWQDVSDEVRRWSRVLAERGVAALLETVRATGLVERLATTAGGERTLTDLRHVGHTLHLAATEDHLGAAALVDWLRRRVDDAPTDYAEERSRRLETDAAAVQVVTIHASKGLEFPVVYVPFEWDRFLPRTPKVLRFHDDAGERYLHVGGSEDGGYRAALTRHRADEQGEDLRLLYVALTRASSQVVAWWAPSSNSPGGPLSRLLLGDRQGGTPPATVGTPGDDEVAARLAELAGRSDGAVVVERVDERPPRRTWSPQAVPGPPLRLATLGRRLDASWGRTSYSALTLAAHAEPGPGVVASEPESPGVVDEEDVTPAAAALPAPEAPGTQVTSPWSDLPAGAAFGTAVHEVLERVDFAAPGLEEDLRAACRERAAGRAADPDALAGALLTTLTTPLGPLAGGRTLTEVSAADRLAELAFELPLAGGDRPRGRGGTTADVADVLRAHLGADDPFAGYPDRLEAAGLDDARLRGYLTGSLDAVLRVPGDAGPRYLVVDYKTNRLGPEGEPLTAWHYRPAATVAAMERAHYPLQLLLYLVALHRYLRWRQPRYDPDTHLGGGLYLFVRGMCGPGTPVLGDGPCGVLGWRPPGGLVTSLSDLLDGRTP